MFFSFLARRVHPVQGSSQISKCFSLNLNEEVFSKIALTMNDQCKRMVNHLYFVQIFELNWK